MNTIPIGTNDRGLSDVLGVLGGFLDVVGRSFFETGFSGLLAVVLAVSVGVMVWRAVKGGAD